MHDPAARTSRPLRRRARRTELDGGWAAIATKPWWRGPASVAGRTARATTFAALSLALAFGAHVVAGGTVSPLAGGLDAAALAGLGWLVSGRERSGRFIGSLVVSTQLASHALFVAPPLLTALRHGAHLTNAELQALLFCHHGANPLTSQQLHQAAHGLDLSRYATGGASVHLGQLLTAAAPMLAAHLVAAAVMAWWLRLGERIVWAAAHRVVVVLATIVRSPSLVVLPRQVHAAREIVVLASVRLASPVSRRGPPQLPTPHLSIV